MTESSLIGRHCNKDGEISRKHGNTLIRTSRKTYGVTFAKNCSDTEKLSDVLHKIDEPSLSSLTSDAVVPIRVPVARRAALEVAPAPHRAWMQAFGVLAQGLLQPGHELQVINCACRCGRQATLIHYISFAGNFVTTF
jgi:hypothetical protein